MKRTWLLITMLLVTCIGTWAQKSSEESVYSAGFGKMRGELKKMTVGQYEGQEVWGIESGTEKIVLLQFDGTPYQVSDAAVMLFGYAQEGDEIEVEGRYSAANGCFLALPVRITKYNATIEGKVDAIGNPATTLPVLPGMVVCIKDSEQGDFIIANQLGLFAIGGEDPTVTIGNQTVSMYSEVRVMGAISERWSLTGERYLDIYPDECYLLSTKPVAEAGSIQTVVANGQVTINSLSPLRSITACGLDGKLWHKAALSGNSTDYRFSPEQGSIFILLVETQDAYMARKLNAAAH